MHKQPLEAAGAGVAAARLRLGPPRRRVRARDGDEGAEYEGEPVAEQLGAPLGVPVVPGGEQREGVVIARGPSLGPIARGKLPRRRQAAKAWGGGAVQTGCWCPWEPRSSARPEEVSASPKAGTGIAQK